MKMTLEMPPVASCEVENCAYNREKSCHARAITIGDGRRPGCDTYFKTKEHHQDAKWTAGVGACKVSSCRYNKGLECSAREIEVGYSGAGEDVLCLTFEQS